MKTVLFATDHIPPNPKALDYALVLCRRVAARLDILHIVQTPKAADSDPLKQLLSDPSDTPISYRCEVSAEAAGRIIERYVRRHRNIVLTVFDPRPCPDPSDIHKKQSYPAGKRAMPKLSIPLVLVKKAQ
ncbi:universal stress protein [Desulfosarcina ovata]|uniref:UspA domain-containing protein n=1 Tax=Desulfosarcina ovata subsp. ovata TaxID=2752305 RepID=A0A5K8AKJ7_9BACT|nr:universal stress protein [Desulfosarcina ovata]BBO93243.1 hypothetical protein DSCOOX_64230 [Desulfosarcina ovata subsp. ovata]